MKCSTDMINGLKEAKKLLGIDFRYKLDDTLDSIQGKLSPKQIAGYLTKRGVSPKEIQQSGILDVDVDKPMSGKEWLHALERKGNMHHTNKTSGSNEFDYITNMQQGVDNPTYKESLTTIKKPNKNPHKMTHFDWEVDRSVVEREVYDTTIEELAVKNLKKVMKEIKEFKGDKLGEEFMYLTQDRNRFLLDAGVPQSLLGWNRTHVAKYKGKDALYLTEFQSDWSQAERTYGSTYKFNKKFKYSEDEEIYMIEKSSDIYREIEATINKSTDLDDYDIPREPELIKQIEDLENQKDIIDENLAFMDKWDRLADFPMNDENFARLQIVEGIDEAIKQGVDKVVIPIEREIDLEGAKEVTDYYNSLGKKTILPKIKKELNKQGLDITISKSSQDYWEIDIKQKGDKPVKWDIWGIIGAMGIGAAVEDGAAAQIERN